LEYQINYGILCSFYFKELVNAVNSEYLQKKFLLVVRHHFAFLFITDFSRNIYNL